ncbi:ribosome small subunit-dependent GTPase A [Bacteroidetes/Chlorobi group bacterium ChocPot_Mid]|nr:MAG: ribosome small subunit-dependent GTPase A [Bacteroidetes/Chlorobi group bacterium ChocPot_Mid]
MILKELGYNDKFEAYRIENKLDDFEIGRVSAEHKERFIVRTTQDEYEAEITGNMRFTAKNGEDYPAVGDWVAMLTYENNFAIIHKIFPRYSVIKRQAIAEFGEVQIIAANIDFAFLLQAVDRDYSINRLERYLTICNSSKVKPVIVLSKIDLIDELRLNEILQSIKVRINDVPVIAISNETQEGYSEINKFIVRGKTYCMLGSSGVGKSTLLNNLSGRQIMRTDTISQSTNKGRHITSHRELIVLENGGILIDNPGMREVAVAGTNEGLEITFDKIYQVSENCKFKDCKHINEIGCAVIAAVENAEIDKSTYENYLKIEKENKFFESSVEERRKRDKEFGKMLKNYKKDVKNKKFRP